MVAAWRSLSRVLLMEAWLVVTVVVAPMATASADAPQKEWSAKQIEHFESRIRPLLVKRCHKCHSHDAKRLEGGLYLDSRQGMLKGGDTGPAIIPGKANESLLVQSIRYEGDYEMPPDGKLSANEIRLLHEWINDGAPWPRGETRKDAQQSFDMTSRIASHWAWHRTDGRVPKTDSVWPVSDIDRFILARLEEQRLKPAGAASKSALLRRVTFDLSGLPPTPDEVSQFLSDDSPRAFETVVNRLLESPRFGERWARHWLDLVRYAESRGHEFDYNTPNAHQYRDYVIRAINADVPYDQFVHEHIAGDLLPNPRRDAEEGFNESILGTGFWFLGEWVHSPVEIRKDETDRYDNMLDVFGKTFLGLTVACARCHDHKFDAISQADYYALAGYLQSSAYRLARFDSLEHNLSIAEKLDRVGRAAQAPLRKAVLEACIPGLEDLASYLVAARDIIRAGPTDEQPKPPADRVLADFEDGTYGGWETTGDAFGEGPHTQKTIAKYQGNVRANGTFFINSHNVRRGDKARHGDQFTGTLTSPPFVVDRQTLRFLVGGGKHAGRTCINLLVDGRVVETATGRNSNEMKPHTWDLQKHTGKRAQIQIVDKVKGGWGNIGADHFVLSNAADENDPAAIAATYRTGTVRTAKSQGLSAARLERLIRHLFANKDVKNALLHPWAVYCTRGGEDEQAALAELVKSSSRPAGKLPKDPEFLFRDNAPFLHDGPTFGVRASNVGEFLLGRAGETPVRGVVTRSSARTEPAFANLRVKDSDNDPGRLGGWIRAGRTVRTPTFTVSDGPVYCLVAGAGHGLAVVSSHRLIQGPLHGECVVKWDHGQQLQWVEFHLRRYQQHRVHLEFSPMANRECAIIAVAQGQRPDDVAWTSPLNPFQRAPSSGRAAAEGLAQSLRAGLLADQTTNVGATAADWVVQQAALLGEPDTVEAKLAAAAGPFIQEREKLIAAIRQESRLAMAMWDGASEDEELLIRGNFKTTRGVVPRRNLIALGGDIADAPSAGSGRLEWARHLTAVENPLTARVMVNRVWHHLFGRGIVASVDNFGVLGERPSHPELLDHLARQFVDGGWSVKTLIRSIVLTKTYQMDSREDPRVREVDPGNGLLQHARIRRLQGEAIRDAILVVSGRFDPKMYGRSVPVHLTKFMTGRGRPRSGPLDGGGRRSVYMSVRRNFLSPMMLAFDMPQPFSSMGRRTISNVPAQALILLNDPFVAQQAEQWAKNVLNETAASTDRVDSMYVSAFGRRPMNQERDAAISFINDHATRLGTSPDDVRCWSDLGHVLFTTKEFIFLN